MLAKLQCCTIKNKSQVSSLLSCFAFLLFKTIKRYKYLKEEINQMKALLILERR